MSRREQIKMSLEDISSYLKESRTIILVSNGKNGYPHPMPMWYAVDEKNTVYMTTFKKSQNRISYFNVGGQKMKSIENQTTVKQAKCKTM